jgi:hypothetical protein
MIEALWLEDLAKDEVYEFLFIASPLKIRAGTGSPLRPLAIGKRWVNPFANSSMGRGSRECRAAPGRMRHRHRNCQVRNWHNSDSPEMSAIQSLSGESRPLQP